jgi:hypothetical protein
VKEECVVSVHTNVEFSRQTFNTNGKFHVHLLSNFGAGVNIVTDTSYSVPVNLYGSNE